MDEEMKRRIVEVARKSDRIMVVKLIFEEKVLNVISAYAPQVECDEIDMEVFCREMDEEMQGVPGNEDVVIGGDMNGHIGNERRGYERVHGGYGFSGKNEAGERILDFAVSQDLAIRWWKLKGDNEEEFVKTVWNVEGDINYVWNRFASYVTNTAKEIVGDSRSRMPENKET
ncbi:uncharacterized protein LOC126894562 [Daktulosphaira vitifoliae]|uniref:uncharacterized protein LOC126894562 n=1 Tax=Daktulosphaira vitifoliae TaxID=58002 RepID=UPI0021A9BF7E|nr:uncharacterized protein LOC126894562 [Daktulosphaira vitifoliae]